MTFRVKLTAIAEKQRKRLTAETKARIDGILEGLKVEARPPGASKLAGSKNDWRVREGDYRILYEIDDEESLITVWRIAHRRETYRA